MGLYLFYKNKHKNMEKKLPQHKGDVDKLNAHDQNVIAEVQISNKNNDQDSSDDDDDHINKKKDKGHKNKESMVIRNSNAHNQDKGMGSFIQPQLPPAVKWKA